MRKTSVIRWCPTLLCQFNKINKILPTCFLNLKSSLKMHNTNTILYSRNGRCRSAGLVDWLTNWPTLHFGDRRLIRSLNRPNVLVIFRPTSHPLVDIPHRAVISTAINIASWRPPFVPQPPPQYARVPSQSLGWYVQRFWTFCGFRDL